MPREQINTPRRRVISLPTKSNGLAPGEWAMHWAVDDEPLGDGENFEDSPTLFIGWHRDAPSVTSEDGSMQFHLHVSVDEVLRAAAEITRSRENPGLSGYPYWVFSTVVLSRVEAQKAIKTIRRARDTVFGADE